MEALPYGVWKFGYAALASNAQQGEKNCRIVRCVRGLPGFSPAAAARPCLPPLFHRRRDADCPSISRLLPIRPAPVDPQCAGTDEWPGRPNAQPPAEEGTIVVTGIRRSLQDSINIKRRERGTVEAVSAEEIGKLPDVSIAGIDCPTSRHRGAARWGRAEIVSIRGFSPDFTTVLLNGRQQASSGFNRAVEFDQYPSELMASVVVYKIARCRHFGHGFVGHG